MHKRSVRAVSTVLLTVALATTAGCSSGSSKKAAATTCPPSNPKPARTVALTTIYANVYNASDTKGEAAQVAQRLTWRGVHVLDVKNDPLIDERQAPKHAEIRYGKAGRTIALNLAQEIPHASLYEDDRTDPTVDIVIGNDFDLTPRPPAAIKDTKVHVYNTSFMPGLAGKVAGELTGRGFTADDRPNDKAYYPDDKAVVVYDEQGLPQAQRLQMHIEGARLLPDTKAGVNIDGTDVNLYLGSKWPEEGKLVPSDKATPTPTPSASPTC